jgi:hypothetical protein
MTDDELSRRILKLAADVGITLGVAPSGTELFQGAALTSH